MLKKGISKIHIFSWLIKDISWCLHFKGLATFMIFPTLFLTGYILANEKEKREENLLVSSWILMNIFWMLSELYKTPRFPIYFFMILGVLLSGLFLRNLLQNRDI